MCCVRLIRCRQAQYIRLVSQNFWTVLFNTGQSIGFCVCWLFVCNNSHNVGHTNQRNLNFQAGVTVMGSRIWMGKAALQDIPHLCHNVIQRKVSSHMTITFFRITKISSWQKLSCRNSLYWKCVDCICVIFRSSDHLICL